jgi:hypothetical protein
MAHIAGSRDQPEAGDFRPKSWRDVVWVLMTAIGVVLLVGASLYM